MYHCNCLNVRVRIKETENPTTVEKFLRENNDTEQVTEIRACTNENLFPKDFSTYLIGSSISGVESVCIRKVVIGPLKLIFLKTAL